MAINNLPAREEYLRLKRRKRNIRISIFLFIILALIGLVSYVAYRPAIRITQVKLSGGILVKEEDVQPAVEKFLSGSYFWLIPKNNAFVYPRKKLEKFLYDNFKRIETIKISRENFKTVDVVITERKPVAIWCDALPTASGPVNENTHCYFMDQNGTIFAESPYFSGDAYFKYYGIVSTTTPIGSNYIASSTEFSDIVDFIHRTNEMQIHPMYLIAKDNDQFSLVLEGGGEIYFDLKEPLAKTAQNLEALLRTPELATSSDAYLPIQYIDLRFGNKLFYKLKGE